MKTCMMWTFSQQFVGFVCIVSFPCHDAEAFVPASTYHREQGGAALFATTASAAESVASVSLNTEIADVLRRVTEEHTTEVRRGMEHFADGGGVNVKQPAAISSDESPVWSDTAFISRSVGVGNAGPDERAMHRGDEVFQTLAPVVSTEECEALIAEAREIIAQGLREEEENHKNDENDGQPPPPQAGRISNAKLGECRVSTMPRGRQWLNTALRDKLFPLLVSRFGGGNNKTDATIRAEELTLHDALVIGYGYFGAPTVAQPIHRDTSILSLNVALSPSTNYAGGGTYFEGLGKDIAVQNEQGHVLCHAGGAMHAGNAITSGERWVLVLFVVAKNEPQLARRCHNQGINEKREGKLQEAHNSFLAGLSVAPRDHLLHLGVGSIHMAKGDKSAAQDSLRKSSEYYPLSQQSLISLGNMHLEEDLNLEALTSYDLALERLNDKDLLPGAMAVLRAEGYHARRNAALCAVILGGEEAAAGKEREFSRSRMPIAIERIQTCLVAAPGDGYMHGMLDRAQELFTEAVEESAQL